MKKLIGFCGIDCEKCDAYIATKNNDNALRERTARLWAQLNNAPTLPEHINCEGCRIEGIKTVFCDSLCAIRKCALEKGIETCGKCIHMDECTTLAALINNNPQAKENLRKGVTYEI